MKFHAFIPDKPLMRRAKQVLRDDGFLSLIKKFFFNHTTHYVWENTLEVSGGIPSLSCKVDNLTLRITFIAFPLEEFEAKYEEAYRLLSAESLDFSSYPDAQQYKTRKELSRGTVVFEALVDGKTIHRTWVATCREGCGIYNYYYHPSRDDRNTAYAGFSMTSEDYQGKGILGYMYSQIYRYFRERGFSRVVLAIGKEVVAAHRVQQKLGSKLLYEGHILKVLGLYYHYTSVVPVIEGKVEVQAKGPEKAS